MTDRAWRRWRTELRQGEMAGWRIGADGAPDVLFLHANGFNAGTYRTILGPLGNKASVLAVDMRGHGHTALPTQPVGHSWRIYATDLLDLIQRVGTPRVLAGHSMGGATALLAAPSLPAEMRLVLFDPVMADPAIYAAGTGMNYEIPIAQGALRRKPGFPGRAEAFAAYRGRGAFTTWPDDILADYLEDGLRETPDGVALSCAPAWEAANFAASMLADPYAGLAAAGCTARVLKAELGSVCSLTDALLPDGAAARVRIETVAGSTHFLPMERVDLVRDALAEALG